jgi:hypothetical protein
MLNSQLGVFLELIRKDIHFDPAFIQGGKELQDTIIRAGLSVPAILVFLFHVSNAALYGALISMIFGQNTFHQFGKAITNRLLVKFGVVNGKSQIAQGFVHRIRQIIDGIQESPIEVEDDSAVIICV